MLKKAKVRKMKKVNAKIKIMNKMMRSISIIMMEKARNKMTLMKIIMIRWLIKMIKMIWIKARKKNHLQLFKKLKKEQVARSLGQQKILQLYL